MEKPSKLRKGILKFLPGSAAASIPFRSPPISPRTANPCKGHQGPTISIIPKGAPRRLKSGSFDAREPSSPMVSCVGQIKSNKKKKKKKIRDPTILKQVLPPQREVMVEQDLHHADDVENKSQSQSQKQKSLITGFLKGIKHGKKNATKEIYVPPNNDITLPYLGSVTKFASGRGALADFDWRAFGVAVVRDCSEPCLDEEEKRTKVNMKVDLDILAYWKDNQFRYPLIAKMTRDILNIPITTVTLESSFSNGGRVLYRYRSSLKHDTIEAFLCTRNWLYEEEG